MASIDVNVPENEMKDFDYENRPVWPRVPTPCPVTVCGPQKFYSFKTFINHWKCCHQEHKLVNICSCGRKFAMRKHLKAHLKLYANHSESEAQCLPNPSYINPYDCMPYQYGTAEDRESMKIVQRQLESKRRREEADKFKDVRHLLYSSSQNNVCRDEIVKLRDGQVVKDTNMWDSPKRRKRVKLDLLQE